MALKDTWVDLQNAVAGVENTGSDVSAEPINNIAHAVIDLEEKEIDTEIDAEIDTEMSDTSENAVQNKVIKSYVDGVKNETKTYIEDTILGGAW